MGNKPTEQPKAWVSATRSGTKQAHTLKTTPRHTEGRNQVNQFIDSNIKQLAELHKKIEQEVNRINNMLAIAETPDARKKAWAQAQEVLPALLNSAKNLAQQGNKFFTEAKAMVLSDAAKRGNLPQEEALTLLGRQAEKADTYIKTALMSVARTTDLVCRLEMPARTQILNRQFLDAAQRYNASAEDFRIVKPTSRQAPSSPGA